MIKGEKMIKIDSDQEKCRLAVSHFFVVCRFVRREKEIAESRFEVVQGESLRHRLRVEHLERELKDVQESLNAEREKMQVGFENPDAYYFITDQLY